MNRTTTKVHRRSGNSLTLVPGAHHEDPDDRPRLCRIAGHRFRIRSADRPFGADRPDGNPGRRPMGSAVWTGRRTEDTCTGLSRARPRGAGRPASVSGFHALFAWLIIKMRLSRWQREAAQ